jgi:hypothetical protein
MPGEDVSRKTMEEGACACPFCHEEMEAWAPWCAVCQVEVRYCPECREPLLKEATVCSSCGAECEE